MQGCQSCLSKAGVLSSTETSLLSPAGRSKDGDSKTRAATVSGQGMVCCQALCRRWYVWRTTGCGCREEDMDV